MICREVESRDARGPDARSTDTEPTVLVLGGGACGTSIAIHLARAGIKTVVCERSRYESARVGEVLAPAARPLLQSLGIWDRFLRDGHLRSPGVRSVWADREPYESDFLFNPYGDGWHIDRARFDLSLAAAAESAGAAVHRQAKPLAVCRTADGWNVDLQFSDGSVSFRPRFLVDATGRSSWLAQRMGSRRISVDRLLGIMARIESSDWVNQDRRLLVEATETGWWYCAPLPNGVIVATCMTDADAAPELLHDPLALWKSELERTTCIRERLAGRQHPASVKIVSANSSRMSAVTGAAWIAVGDAAMTWDPLSSQGIVKAIQESRSAALAVCAALSGDNMLLDEYGQRIKTTFDEYCKIRNDYYGRVRRWPCSKFWLNRQSDSDSLS